MQIRRWIGQGVEIVDVEAEGCATLHATPAGLRWRVGAEFPTRVVAFQTRTKVCPRNYFLFRTTC
jgi:hypothetical protein